jgi:DNA-binding GntR family transcriptional regulator
VAPDSRLSTQRVLEILRDRIIRGELAGGSRLVERDISQELGTSRMPVRESFPILEAERLIDIVPRSGAVVRHVTEQSVHETIDVRIALESLACRTLAYRRDERVTGLAVDPRGPADTPSPLLDPQDVGSNSRRAYGGISFHEQLVRLAGNDILTGYMLSLLPNIQRISHLSTPDTDPDESCAGHQDICRAIAAGNSELAVSLSHAHIERGRDIALRNLLAGR